MDELLAWVIEALDILFNIALLIFFVFLALGKAEDRWWQEIMSFIGWLAVGSWLVKKTYAFAFTPFDWLFGGFIG